MLYKLSNNNSLLKEFRLYYADYAVICAILWVAILFFILKAYPPFADEPADAKGPSIWFGYSILVLNILGCVLAVISYYKKERTTRKHVAVLLNFSLVLYLLMLYIRPLF